MSVTSKESGNKWTHHKIFHKEWAELSANHRLVLLSSPRKRASQTRRRMSCHYAFSGSVHNFISLISSGLIWTHFIWTQWAAKRPSLPWLQPITQDSATYFILIGCSQSDPSPFTLLVIAVDFLRNISSWIFSNMVDSPERFPKVFQQLACFQFYVKRVWNKLITLHSIKILHQHKRISFSPIGLTVSLEFTRWERVQQASIITMVSLTTFTRGRHL